MIIAVISDLIFKSKIREALSDELRFVRSIESLQIELASPGAKRVLVDLHASGLDPVEAVRVAAESGQVDSIIAFGSHVEHERLKAAGDAGATEVMPRSVFVQWLDQQRSQRGAGALTLLVFGSIVFTALYYLYHVIPFFYDFYELENQMQASIHLAMQDTDEKIHKKLARTIKDLGIPADAAQMIIRRENNHMDIRLQYREVFYLTFREKDYVLQTFDFDAHAYGDF